MNQSEGNNCAQSAIRGLRREICSCASAQAEHLRHPALATERTRKDGARNSVVSSRGENATTRTTAESGVRGIPGLKIQIWGTLRLCLEEQRQKQEQPQVLRLRLRIKPRKLRSG